LNTTSFATHSSCTSATLSASCINLQPLYQSSGTK
jgi:hypothetical protein